MERPRVRDEVVQLGPVGRRHGVAAARREHHLRGEASIRVLCTLNTVPYCTRTYCTIHDRTGHQSHLKSIKICSTINAPVAIAGPSQVAHEESASPSAGRSRRLGRAGGSLEVLKRRPNRTDTEYSTDQIHYLYANDRAALVVRDDLKPIATNK